MKSPWRQALTAFALLLCAAFTLSAEDVKTDYNHQVHFSQVHTYSWGDITTTNQVLLERIKDEVDKDLEAIGWTQVSFGGDAIVFARTRVHNPQELRAFYSNRGDGWGGRWGWRGWGGSGFGEASTPTSNQAVGMLVIDIFEANSKNLIWRGASLADLSTASKKTGRLLDKDIDKMFHEFPPRKQ